MFLIAFRILILDNSVLLSEPEATNKTHSSEWESKVNLYQEITYSCTCMYMYE